MRGQRFKESRRDAYDGLSPLPLTTPFLPLIMRTKVCMHITGPNTEFPRQWPNLMAFYAHLSSTHIVPHDPMYTIWTMREAFRAPTNPRFEGERDQWILAAAQFILWDGTELFKHVLAPDLDDERPSLQPGLLCFSEYRLCLRRWHFWKSGFEKAVEGDSELGEECRRVARKAASLMGAIEECLMF
jgi:hypothetical protein